MIISAVPLREGEVVRLGCMGFMRARVRVRAADATVGAIEVRRGFGPGGPIEPYTEAIELDLAGDEPTTLLVDDCPELVLVVTTGGSGSFEVEWSLDLPVQDRFMVHHVPLGTAENGTLWESGALIRGERQVSFAVTTSDAAGTAVAILGDQLDSQAQFQDRSGAVIALDGGVSTYELGPAHAIRVATQSGEADLEARLCIYLCGDPIQAGILPPNIAYLDQSQEFTAAKLFSGPVSIGDLSTGITSLATDASANRSVTFPDLEGELAVVSTPSPASGDYLRRSGNGYEATKNLAAEDGSESAPGLTFANDTNNGFFLNATDDWRATVGGNQVLYFQLIAGVFTTLVFSADFVSIGATTSWLVSAPKAVVSNTNSASGGKLALREASTNGSTEVGIVAPANLASAYDLELPDAQPADGDGLMAGASGKLTSSPYAGCIALGWETASAYSSTTNGGFGWSMGARSGGDGFGVEFPYACEIVAISVSGKTVPATSTTIEVYKGTRGSTSSGTGLSVTMSTSQAGNTAVAGSPIAVSSGEYIVPRTTGGSGGTGGRVVIWVRPTP